jgi:hypothetical protein
MTPASTKRSKKPLERLKTRPHDEEWEIEAFAWPALFDESIHELKIAIAEALDWIGEPLSATELWIIFDLKHTYHNVAYHARSLEETGLTVEVWQRGARGATEIYYAPARHAGE